MQETCVLSLLPVIPQWKIYNLPSKKQVQYSLILKQKEELQSLVVSALLSRNLKTFSCTIIDKRICLQKKNKFVNVVFLNQVLNNLLTLKLSVNEQYVVKRRNNFIVFIKNIHSNVRYMVQNDCIYVKCESELQWDIFYNLFEFLLVRNRMSIIGAIFYDSFVCYFMMNNEKEACRHLSSNMYWEVSQKEEHELNFNLLKSRNTLKRSQKCSILHCDNLTNNGMNLATSREKPSFESNIRMKRKLVISEDDYLSSVKKAKKVDHCFCETISCKCHNAEWKVFQNISKYSVTNYLDILLSKGVVSDDELCFTQENKSFNVSDTPLAMQNSNDYLSKMSSKSSVNDEPDVPDERLEKETTEIIKNHNSQNKMLCQSSDQYVIDASTKEIFDSKPVETLKEKENENNIINTPDIPENESKFACDKNRHSNGKQSDSFLCDDFFVFGNDTNRELDMFQTAAGKKVVISDTALQAAQKMFGEVFQTDNTSFSENKSLKSAKLELPAIQHHPTKITTDDYIEENIDKTLADKIFEEISFDDKEIESSSNVLSFQSPFVCAENTVNRSTSSGKVRKSLGGRRSLKPYST